MQFLRDDIQTVLTDGDALDLREIALVFLRHVTEKPIGHHHAKDAVAKKLQPFVVADLIRRLICVGPMGEGKVQQAEILNGNA
jgi:hypothetical protein